MAKNNIVKLTGNLGADPQFFEKEEKKFAVLSIATTERYRNKDSDEWKDREPVWHNVITFKPDVIEKMKSLKKGVRVLVEGSISYRPFETTDENGKTITKRDASIIANNIELAILIKKTKEADKKNEKKQGRGR